VTLTILKAKCFPNMGKRVVNLPLFAQGRGDRLIYCLGDGQLEQVSLFTVGERDGGLTFLKNR
jgi:hypothetical protein